MRYLVLWVLAILAGVIAVAPRVSSGSTATYKDIMKAEDDYRDEWRAHHEMTNDLVMEVGGMIGDTPVTGEIYRQRDTRCMNAVLVGLLVLGAYFVGHSAGKAQTGKWPMVAAVVIVVCVVALLVGYEFWSARSYKAEATFGYGSRLREREWAKDRAKKSYLQVLKGASEDDLRKRLGQPSNDEIRRMLEEELERRRM